MYVEKLLIKRVTIEYDNTEDSGGYKEACNFLEKEFKSRCFRMIKSGPKLNKAGVDMKVGQIVVEGVEEIIT